MTPTAIILIVDDNEYSLQFYEALMQEHNHTVIKARNGIEALDRFQKCPPDLVIVDLMMPGLNGLELCRRLRCSPHGNHVPILAVSGLNDEQTRASALRSGATDFLGKPFQSAEFTRRIQALLQPPAR
ncbi:MAG: response regulator [Verrucomicrobiae bacterium]|nr:response regulator [Verrucomicrobiae bacterium]